MNVATRLIWPRMRYDLGDYSFAHDEYWSRAGVEPDVWIDRNRWDGSDLAAYARDLFWDCVADYVTWPEVGVISADYEAAAKAAARRRADEKAGTIELF